MNQIALLPSEKRQVLDGFPVLVAMQRDAAQVRLTTHRPPLWGIAMVWVILSSFGAALAGVASYAKGAGSMPMILLAIGLCTATAVAGIYLAVYYAKPRRVLVSMASGDHRMVVQVRNDEIVVCQMAVIRVVSGWYRFESDLKPLLHPLCQLQLWDGARERSMLLAQPFWDKGASRVALERFAREGGVQLERVTIGKDRAVQLSSLSAS